MVISNESTASTTTMEMENQVEGGLLLDVVVTKGAAILKLFTSKDETLLIYRDPFLVLNLGSTSTPDHHVTESPLIRVDNK